MALHVVACIGASTVAGKGQAFDWIGELRSRPENAGIRFVNLGVVGDLSHTARLRLSSVILARPDLVIIHIGGNDILSSVFPSVRRMLHLAKGFFPLPSAGRFRDTLREMVHELKQRTSARIVLISLAPIGEDPGSGHKVQRKLNALHKQYAATIERIAREEGVRYVPLYDKMCEQIAASPGRAFTGLRPLRLLADTFRYAVLRESADAIARRNGWRFHVDGIHLNSRGGEILADLVQEILPR